MAQARRSQARGVSLRAQHDDLRVVAGQLDDPGVAPGIEAPLQHVAPDDDRVRHLAFLAPLLDGPDVDHRRSGGHGPIGGFGIESFDLEASVGKEIVDALQGSTPAELPTRPFRRGHDDSLVRDQAAWRELVVGHRDERRRVGVNADGLGTA